MRKLWLIARREYSYNLRRRSFLFTAFGVPIFTFVMWALIFGVADETVSGTGQLGDIGYVDEVGFLADAIDKPEEYIAFEDTESAQEALLAGDIGAYFVVVDDFMNAGEVDVFSVEGVPEGIEDQFEDFVRTNLVYLAPPDAPIDRLLNPLNVVTVELSTGNEVEEDAFFGKIMVPIVFALIFMMAVNTTSQFLMSGVVEEKENRMMEILATSSTPLEMLWGKVLGLGGLGLTQVVVWAVAGFFLLNAQPDSTFLAGISITPELAILGLIYLVLGYFLFGSIMAAIGAAVSAEQEGRQFAGLFTLVVVLPMILVVNFIEDPNSTVPVVLSLIPLTAPVAMLMRLPLAPVPLWEVLVSIALLVVSVVIVVWFAARIFRLGMLMYGKRLSLGEIINALRQGRRTMTSVAGAEGN